MPTIKAVIFDVYKTLLNIHTDENRLETYRFLSSWLSYHGLRIEPEALKQAYRETVRQELDSNPEPYPDVKIEEVFRKILSNYEILPPDTLNGCVHDICILFRMLTTDFVHPYPEAIPMLQTLRQHVKLAIVSNAQRCFTIPEFKKCDIKETYFDSIVFSSDFTIKKPNPNIFQAALNALNIRPQEAIYVGDTMFDDVWGAQQLGMKTLWINRGCGNTVPSGLKKPVPDKKIAGDAYHALCRVVMDML